MGPSQIAELLHLSVKTIETHKQKIKKKLNLSSGSELTRCAMQWILEQV
jgi:DNA-binding NarL/FixJ family response regulator